MYLSVFGLVFIAVTVSIHLCVVCHHFICLMSLFQGHVAYRNLPQQGLIIMLINHSICHKQHEPLRIQSNLT